MEFHGAKLGWSKNKTVGVLDMFRILSFGEQLVQV